MNWKAAVFVCDDARGRSVTCCGQTQMIAVDGASLHVVLATRLVRIYRRLSTTATDSLLYPALISLLWRFEATFFFTVLCLFIDVKA